MSNKGLNKVRIWASDIPNVDSIISCCCNKPTVKGETAVCDFFISYMEFGHNYSGVRVLNYNIISITQCRLSMVWRESNVETIICRRNLVAISIPLPNFATRCGDEVGRVYGREANVAHNILLLYSVMASPCLNVPQTNCVVPRS